MNKNPKHRPRVSIVFVNWNGKKYTFDLLESLKKINYKNYDIIVVDNDSFDGTQKEFKKKYSNYATLIENKKNFGLAEGTNMGFREGLKRGSKYILTMNNDMVVDPDFLNILVDRMERHPEVAVSGPKIYYMEPKNMIWGAGCDFNVRGFIPRNQKEIDKGQTEGDKYVDALDCVQMIRSDVLKKEGLFDSDFFVMCELTGFCFRLTQKGYKCLYVPESIIWHKVSAALSTAGKKTTYLDCRNWIWVIKRNKGKLFYWKVSFLQATIFGLIRTLKFIKRKQPELIFPYFKGVWHGITDKTDYKLVPKFN